jgi:hypothetical protein
MTRLKKNCFLPVPYGTGTLPVVFSLWSVVLLCNILFGRQKFLKKG